MLHSITCDLNRAKEVVISYLTSLSNQDFKTARNYLKDDMTFQAPIASYDSADAYFKGNEELRSKYGVKVVYDIKKVIADRNDVCAFFNFSPGPVTIFASGWFQVNEDGKISSIRVVFDPRPIVGLLVED